MDGKQAALVSTDPPYLVDYTGDDRPRKSKDWSGSYREVDIKNVEGFIRGFVQTALAHSRDNAAWFVWHASRRAALLERLLVECGLIVHQTLIWFKPTPTFTYSLYAWSNEPCFLCWRQGHKPYMIPGWFNQLHSNVWEVDWEGKSRASDRAHPTQKPVELFARPIRNHTQPGEVCLEPFSGSGTQLVAAENMKRLCYANELEPQFVAVALQRMVDAFGLKPKLIDHERPKAKGKSKKQ
ncbi:MAG TPA: DNA methyltransferase [Anaerolineae bacterium]|nr:DNA methyltransferase [Anaerolineae bacterium]